MSDNIRAEFNKVASYNIDIMTQLVNKGVLIKLEEDSWDKTPNILILCFDDYFKVEDNKEDAMRFLRKIIKKIKEKVK